MVNSDGPCHDQIRVGDQITEIDGNQVNNKNIFKYSLGIVGSKVKIGFLRGI